jgi:predicted PurR-regulated permease PerM
MREEKYDQKTNDYLPPRWVIGTVVIVLVVWILYSLREMVVLVVCGYAIAYLINPLISYLEKKGIRRSLGIVVITLVALLTLTLLAITILPTLALQIASLIENLPQYAQSAQDKFIVILADIDMLLENYLGKPIALSSSVQKWFAQFDLARLLSADMVTTVSGGVLATLLKGYSLTLTILNLTLLPFIVYYLALDFRKFHYSLLLWAPKRHRHYVRKVAGEIDDVIGGFFKGQTTVAIILTIIYLVGLGILGIEQWFAVGVISGMGNVLPYLGTLVGGILATLMTLSTYGTIKSVLLVWGLYGIVQVVEGNFITPRLVGEKVGLPPLMVILALFAGASLFGLLGILFAVPVAAGLKVLTMSLRKVKS